MSDFDAQIKITENEYREAQKKINALSANLEAAREKMATGAEIEIDIENASLEDVHAHS